MTTVLSVAAACRPRGPAVFEAVPAPVRLTASPGLEIDPSFSPDGKELVYSSSRTGTFELYTRSLGDGTERVLTADGKQNFQPSHSPDGKAIVYHSRERIGIWSIPSAGGEPRLVADFGSHPRYSPDGRSVVFQSEALDSLSLGSSPPSTIWVVPSVGGPARNLTAEGVPKGGHGNPLFTRDGNRILFVSQAAAQTGADLYSVGLDGKDQVRLLSAPRLFEPVLARDGETLYFGGTTEKALSSVMVARIPGGKLPVSEPTRTVTRPSTSVPRSIALSPDGRRLVWSEVSGTTTICSLPISAAGLATGAPRALTPPLLRQARPMFSPDGRRIAFDRRLPGQNEDVWVMDADGGNATQVTSGPLAELSRGWFPDGRRLFVVSMAAGRDEVRALAVDVETKTATPLPLPTRDIGPARLSPDGTRVAFHAHSEGSTRNVWTVGFDGKPPVQLTFDREQISYPVFSPDGRYLALEAKRGDDVHVAVMPSGGGTPQQLTFERGLSWASGFSPDGDKVLFAGLRRQAWNIYWVSRTSLAIVQLTRYPPLESYVRYPSWSPRGDQIAYELGQQVGSLYTIVAREP